MGCMQSKFLFLGFSISRGTLANDNLAILVAFCRNQAKLQRNLMYLAAIADSQPQPPSLHSQVSTFSFMRIQYVVNASLRILQMSLRTEKTRCFGGCFGFLETKSLSSLFPYCGLHVAYGLVTSFSCHGEREISIAILVEFKAIWTVRF